MNRERLTILRDHLASLPDESFSMMYWPVRASHDCGSAVCIGGWADRVFKLSGTDLVETYVHLGLSAEQGENLCFPADLDYERLKTSDAISAIQSMLDSSDDDALPVWPEKAEAAQ